MDWLAGDGDGTDADVAAMVRLLETLEAAPCTLLLNAFCALSRYEDIFAVGYGSERKMNMPQFRYANSSRALWAVGTKVSQSRGFDVPGGGGGCFRPSSLQTLKLEKLASLESKVYNMHTRRLMEEDEDSLVTRS